MRLREFATRLNELALGAGLPAEPVASSSPDEAQWIFRTQANEYLVKFDFNPEPQEDEYGDYDDYEMAYNNSGMNTAFYARDKNGQWTMDITNVGEKELTQIIATVARLLAEFLKQHKHLTHIGISGKDRRRDQIYQRLIQQNLQRYFPGQEFAIDQGGIRRVIKEFAPTEPGGNDDGDVPPNIYTLANRWWNNTDDQDRIAMVLRSMGWDIQQADGEEDVCQLTYRDGSVYYLNDGEFDPDLFENKPRDSKINYGGQSYLNTPRIQSLIQQAQDIESRLPMPAPGTTRLWRGNRPGEEGSNPTFTNSLVGIALPFQEQYGGKLSYIDVPTKHLTQYTDRVASAADSEFTVPKELAAKAHIIKEISDKALQTYLGRADRQVSNRLDRMAQARERLSRGWEIYDANKPTRIIDRFEANSPQEAKQYYQNYIDNYNPGDENFEFYLRRSTGIIEDAEPTVQQAHRDGLDLTAHRHGNELVITADAHGRNLAQVVFLQYGDKNLEAKDLLVDEAYRGQGIAAVMYDYAKALGYQVERSDAQTDAGKHFWDKNRGPKRVWETELDEIARIPQSELGGWGDKDTLAPMTKPPKNRKPLPGGSQFTYAVNRKDPEFMEIMIFDGDTLAAELDLFATLDPLKTWGVETVVTDPDYRGRGLGKALYGIALSILKLTLEAGETQTKHGQAMWVMLNSIPGVEVKGYAMDRTAEYRAKPGDNVVDQNDTWTRYTFPVEPGKRSMRSTRSGTGIYSSQHVSMIAKWTGR